MERMDARQIKHGQMAIQVLLLYLLVLLMKVFNIPIPTFQARFGPTLMTLWTVLIMMVMVILTTYTDGILPVIIIAFMMAEQQVIKTTMVHTCPVQSGQKAVIAQVSLA